MVLDLEFDPNEWSRLTSAERIRRCLRFAEQARMLGAEASPEANKAYQELAQHWLTLADEIGNDSPNSARSAQA
jgi:hypothetical protein